MSPENVDEIGIRGEERSILIRVVTISWLREFIHHFSHGFLVDLQLHSLWPPSKSADYHEPIVNATGGFEHGRSWLVFCDVVDPKLPILGLTLYVILARRAISAARIPSGHEAKDGWFIGPRGRAGLPRSHSPRATNRAACGRFTSRKMLSAGGGTRPARSFRSREF